MPAPARIAGVGALTLGLLLIVSGAEARALEASIAAGNAPAAVGHEPGHRCKCRMHCKTACCCTPVETQPETHAAPVSVPPTPSSANRASGPCLKAAPCGGTALPTAASGVRLGASAALADMVVFQPATAGVAISLSLALIPPSAAPERIDEPPEPCTRV